MLYTFKCTKCGKEVEILTQVSKRDDVRTCEECKEGELKRAVESPNFVSPVWNN